MKSKNLDIGHDHLLSLEANSNLNPALKHQVKNRRHSNNH